MSLFEFVLIQKKRYPSLCFSYLVILLSCRFNWALWLSWIWLLNLGRRCSSKPSNWIVPAVGIWIGSVRCLRLLKFSPSLLLLDLSLHPIIHRCLVWPSILVVCKVRFVCYILFGTFYQSSFAVNFVKDTCSLTFSRIFLVVAGHLAVLFTILELSLIPHGGPDQSTYTFPSVVVKATCIDFFLALQKWLALTASVASPINFSNKFPVLAITSLNSATLAIFEQVLLTHRLVLWPQETKCIVCIAVLLVSERFHMVHVLLDKFITAKNFQLVYKSDGELLTRED